jgi:hypothetical protein
MNFSAHPRSRPSILFLCALWLSLHDGPHFAFQGDQNLEATMKATVKAPSCIGSRVGSAGAAMTFAFFLWGCAHQAPSLKPVEGRSCREPEELLDVLTRFSTAVQQHDYHQALAYLAPQDQARMQGADGKVPEGIKVKLDALDFKSLATDRRIDLVHGRLVGVFACLPCLDEGPAAVVSKDQPKPPAPGNGEEKKRKAMAKDFYNKAQQSRWSAVSRLVHPEEWKIFADEKGRVSDLNERRLQAIQECDLDALTLKDGRLTGIVLLLEPPVSDLYLKANVFFDLVDADRLQEAVGMLLESEKKFFVDKDGKLRPDRMEKLKAMDRGEWNRLYLYHDVLLGVAEAAVGYENL